MSATNLSNCVLIDFDTHTHLGKGVDIIANKHVQFQIKRIYYISDVPHGTMRGSHANMAGKQVLISINGTINITLDDGHERKIFKLDDCTKGLYIAPGIWRELTDFSLGSILLVIADNFVENEVYIKDYDLFKKSKNQTASLQ